MSERSHYDYLVVGAGAMGMAFVDTLIAETDASVLMVDKHPKPGGHWNIAYPFVTLHQPSSFYGVASKELSKGRIDQSGLNKGMADLATLPEIQAYYESVMRDIFLPSGQVTYWPSHDYQGDGQVRSLLSGEVRTVEFDTIVDAAFWQNSVPANHTPSFEVAEGVNFMPCGDVTRLSETPAGFVVIGGGKTGMDTLLHLLEQGADADDITWIISRDGWVLNRANTQPRVECFERTMGAQAAMFEAIATSSSRDDMFLKLEACGYFMRLDPDVLPQMFHAPTVSDAEMEALRQIKNIVRLGHVTRIEPDRIMLVDGLIPTSPDHVHLDCSASAVKNSQTTSVFKPGRITLQTVRAFQPTFSASLIAHVEASDRSLTEKNALTCVVPLPNGLDDFVRMQAAHMMNQAIWGRDRTLLRWIKNNRLDGFSQMVSEADKSDPTVVEILGKFQTYAVPAVMKLQNYMNA